MVRTGPSDGKRGDIHRYGRDGPLYVRRVQGSDPGPVLVRLLRSGRRVRTQPELTGHAGAGTPP